MAATLSKIFSLDQYLGNKYVILFFYPRDFTYVCPTEIHAFQEKLGDFDARNCAVVGVSTDTPESHRAYLKHAQEGRWASRSHLPFGRRPEQNHFNQLRRPRRGL